MKGAHTISGCAGLIRTHPLHSKALTSSATIDTLRSLVRSSALARSLLIAVILLFSQSVSWLLMGVGCHGRRLLLPHSTTRI